MSEHPDRETLEGFLLNHLPAGEVKSAVAHLLGGCDHCRQELSPIATAMFTLEAGLELQLSAEESPAYDRAIAAAFGKALAVEKRVGSEREEAIPKSEVVFRALERPEALSLPEGEVTWGLCESLLEKSRVLRYTDHAGMLRLAELARVACDRLDPAVHGAERRSDMQARAWAELANAYRVANEFAQAEAAMGLALELRAQGTGDPLLYARIADLSASLAYR